jgi:hypothetical protein
MADKTERFERIETPLPSSAPSASRMSVPPSEPRPSRTSFGMIDVGDPRPARLQMIVALLLGLVLVAIPLYLWRRPRAESIAASSGPDAGSYSLPPPVEDTKVVLGEPKVRECHDLGAKKTHPDQCDHVLELEKALAKAIEENAACVPRDAGGGTIVYVADVNFKKKQVVVITPKEGRTLKSQKAVETCRAAVKGSLQTAPLDAMVHQHARYKLSINAIYPGGTKVTPVP